MSNDAGTTHLLISAYMTSKSSNRPAVHDLADLIVWKAAMEFAESIYHESPKDTAASIVANTVVSSSSPAAR